MRFRNWWTCSVVLSTLKSSRMWTPLSPPWTSNSTPGKTTRGFPFAAALILSMEDWWSVIAMPVSPFARAAATIFSRSPSPLKSVEAGGGRVDQISWSGVLVWSSSNCFLLWSVLSWTPFQVLTLPGERQGATPGGAWGKEPSRIITIGGVGQDF